MKLKLENILSSRYQQCNIFKVPTVARHFCFSHHIPDDVLAEISYEILNEIEVRKGKQKTYRILEVGIGAGRFTYPFAKELIARYPGSTLYGVDNSRAMIAESKKLIGGFKGVEYSLHDIIKPLSFSRDFFEASISFYVYHCIKDWRKALENVIDVTTPPKLMIFVRERSQWGYHLDNRFRDIEISDKDYCRFWKEYFKLRRIIVPLPEMQISASDIGVLVKHLRNKGFRHFHRILKTRWDRPVDYDEALTAIGLGLFTKLRVGLTARDRHALKKEMIEWLKKENIPVGASGKTMPAAIELDIFTKK